jgi:outer membrane protein TolC
LSLRLISRLDLVLLFAGVLLLSARASFAQFETTPTPGQPMPGTQGVSPVAGSVPAKSVPGVIAISLQDPIDRGWKQNLRLLLSDTNTRAARGQRWEQLSALRTHVTATPYVADSQINLAELGFTSIGGATLPASVGPFSYFDARVNVAQSLFDSKLTRAASQNLKSAEYPCKGARDLVVPAVGYVYLQATADEARIATAEAPVATAKALYDQAADQVKAGTSSEIDVLRAKLELQTRQQQLIQAKNNFGIQKLTVARVIGLAPGQEFELTDKSPYRAYASRSDYLAAMTDVRAAVYARQAAVAGYCPSLSFNADYGAAGSHPSTATQVRGTLSIPIFQGNRADILQAHARLQQTRGRLDNLRAQIDADMRTALLNLQSSADQENVARSSIDLAEATLLQSQEAVASAHEQYISSLYNYNFARISLVRAMGIAEAGVKEYFKEK